MKAVADTLAVARSNLIERGMCPDFFAVRRGDRQGVVGGSPTR